MGLWRSENCFSKTSKVELGWNVQSPLHKSSQECMRESPSFEFDLILATICLFYSPGIKSRPLVKLCGHLVL